MEEQMFYPDKLQFYKSFPSNIKLFALIFAGTFLLLLFLFPKEALAKDCQCNVQCTSASGQTISTGTTFSGFKGRPSLNKELDRCQQICTSFINSQMDKLAADNKVCGALTCKGTYHIDTTFSSPTRTTAPITKNYNCSSAGAGCCAPATQNDLFKLFFSPQNKPNQPYTWKYDAIAAATPQGATGSVDSRMIATLGAAHASNTAIVKLAAEYSIIDVSTGALKDVFYVSYLWPTTVVNPTPGTEFADN